MFSSEISQDFSYRNRYPMTEIWLDEAIWGHRIYDESSPELILLELLNVVDSLLRSHKEPFRAGRRLEEQIKTSYRKSLVLRTILFNNATLRIPLEAGYAEDEAWEFQLNALRQTWSTYSGVTQQIDFSYLRQRFPSYRRYVELIETLRRGAIEFESNKRWTSKFLFPYCPESLFEDLNDKRLSTDRRFFGRSGELAYLMLARSGYGDEIWQGLRSVLFDRATHATRWKKAIASLAHSTDFDSRSSRAEEQTLGYLPYESHQVFEIFGHDVKTLLNAGMPEYDVLPYLARLITFHLLHYVLVIAAEGLDDPFIPKNYPPVTYVLEIQSERTDVTRRLARNSFQLNNELPYRRIQTAIRRLRELEEVQEAISSNDRARLEQLLENRWWVAVRKKARDAKNAAQLWHAFEKAVKNRHRQHLGKVHHEYARLCGLASRAGTNAYRYAPTDGFLTTIVLANVSRRLDYDEFLDLLYQRYGFVIAKRHARARNLGGDLTDFDLNNRRLQTRLTRLGLMHRLSDACAYVVNRYREDG